MNNPEAQSNENRAQSEPAKMPLFNQNVTPQTSNNVMPQISNSSQQNQTIVEPQNTLKSNGEKLTTENLDSPAIENTNSSTINNVETHQEKNVAPANLEKSGVKRKSRKKPAKKKTYSQKRNVVPLKFFGSLKEKAGLEIKAKEKGLSLSNYIRITLELPPNMTGRKKTNDLLLNDDVDLDSDIENAFKLLHR